MKLARGCEILQLKIDLHVHSHYSYDSIITPKEIVFYAKKRGLDGIAITDHNRVDGASKIMKTTDFLIISGVEVSCLQGHVVGLNVKEPIPQGLSVEETVEKIHDAGGVAIACHPTALFKLSLGNRINSDFDAVEVINSSALPFGRSVEKSMRIASRFKLPCVAGSDAHYGPEIGCAYTLVEAEPKVDSIVEAIRVGHCQPFGKAIPLGMRLKRELLILRKKL